MAFLSNQEEEQKSGMTLDQNGQQSNSEIIGSPEAQNEPQNVSGGGSAVIGQGSTPQASNQPKRGVGSGTHTNLQKYVKANRGAGQKMAQTVQRDVGNQASQIGQQVQKQKQEFQTQLKGNQQRLQESRQFGQQAIQRASNLQNTQDLEARRQALQQRIGTFQQPAQQFDASQLQSQQQNLANLQAQQEQLKPYIGDYTRGQELQSQIENTQYEGPEAPTSSNRGSVDFRRDLSKYQAAYGEYEQQQAQRQAELDEINARLQGVEGLDQLSTLGGDIQAAQQSIYDLQAQERAAQDYQAQVQRQQDLQAEIAGIEEKIANAPETLTEEEIQRFRDIQSGKIDFDTAQYQDVGGAEARAAQLEKLSRLGGTESGRRELLRRTFQDQNYSRGKSALDNLLIQANPEVAANLDRQLRETGQSTMEGARGARINALRQMAGQAAAANNLREQLGTGVSEATTDLEQALQERIASGEGSTIANLQQAVEEGLLSAEQAQQLGLEDGRAYGVDLAEQLGSLGDIARTRESVGTQSDLARAQALAALAGKQQQTTFANEDLIGQMSEAERQRLSEIQDLTRQARRDFESQVGSLGSQADKVLGGDHTDAVWDAAIRSDSKAAIQALQNLAQEKGDLRFATEGEIMDALKTSGIDVSEYNKMVGFIDQSLSLQNQRQQMLNEQQGRIGVEGQNFQSLEQERADREKDYMAKKQALELLAQATGSRQAGRRETILKNQNLIDAFRNRFR